MCEPMGFSKFVYTGKIVYIIMLLFGVRFKFLRWELVLSENYPQACLIISTTHSFKKRVRIENEQQNQKANQKK